MNILLLCEALAQKIIERMDIVDPSEVDFAARPDFEALLDSLDLDQEDLAELSEFREKYFLKP